MKKFLKNIAKFLGILSKYDRITNVQALKILFFLLKLILEHKDKINPGLIKNVYLIQDMLMGKKRVLICKTKEDIQELLKQVKQKLKELYGAKLKRIILYGSYAQGKATDDSDIDIAVVLAPPINWHEEAKRIKEELYKLELDTGHLISIYPITEDELQEDRWPLYYNIRTYGCEI